MEKYTIRIEVILDIEVEDRDEAESRAQDQASWIRRSYLGVPNLVQNVYTEVMSVEDDSF